MKIIPNGIAVLENDLASRWIEENNDLVHEPTVRVEICPHLKPGDVVVDAGAYLGSHTRAYLDAVGPTGKVIAFEPNPLAFQCLVHNCKGAQFHNMGLSDRVEWCLPIETRENNHGATLWKPVCSDAGINRLFTDLDCFKIQKLDFMKIDVEGMEAKLIRGAIETLARCRPLLYVELNRRTLAAFGETTRSLVSLIESLNYKIQFMLPEHNLDCEEINVFFLPL